MHHMTDTVTSYYTVFCLYLNSFVYILHLNSLNSTCGCDLLA
jgi:hypothetical protein